MADMIAVASRLDRTVRSPTVAKIGIRSDFDLALQTVGAQNHTDVYEAKSVGVLMCIQW